MVHKDQVLKALTDTSRNCPLKVKELAEYLEASPLVISVQLNRLSKEKFVAKKEPRRGWFITKQGKRKLQMLGDLFNASIQSKGKAFRTKYAAELEEAIRNAEGLDRGKFLEIGKAIGVPPNLVLLTTDYIWNMGCYMEPARMWHDLAPIDLRWDLRRFWFYAWFAHLRRKIPEDIRSEIDGS
jgi:DNA-binding transcriptional regulator YhcF (GntR family)